MGGYLAPLFGWMDSRSCAACGAQITGHRAAGNWKTKSLHRRGCRCCEGVGACAGRPIDGRGGVEEKW